MEKVKTMTTETYTYGGGFLIDVVTETVKDGSLMWSAWIYHEDYGVKDLVFGVSSYYDTEEGFLEKVENVLPQHIGWYWKEYMHDDLD